MSRAASLAGSLLLLVFSSNGAISPAASDRWAGPSPGPPEAVRESLAAVATAESPADFNGDGYADLAIGVPKEDLGEINNAGAVNVLYGSPTAPNILSSTDDQKWTQDSDGVREMAEKGDQFGWALAWGDFDYDGYDDLAIGIKGEHVGEDSGAGAVSVLYGSASGLTAEGDQYFTQNTTGIADTAENDDNFGYAVAAADFGSTCDGFGDDLAIGVRNEDLGSDKKDAGAVNVIYSDGNGLDACGDQFWTQDSSGVEGVAEADDRYGSSLAAGDFDGFDFADLAIGVPEEDLGTAVDAGAVNELRSYTGRLISLYDEFWSQNKGQVTDEAETGDLFGYALALGGRFGVNDNAYLAIGVYGEDGMEGAVNVLSSTNGGLSDGPQFFLTQVGTEETGAQFGFALAAVWMGPGSVSTPILAIGAPGDDIGAASDGGSVTLQYWSDGAPRTATVWTQDSTDLEDVTEAGDAFGSSLTLAATSGIYRAMLAIGVPEEDVGSIVDAGGVNVMYADSVDFDASDDQFWSQDSDGVNDSAEAKDSFGEGVA
jgi:hypothetical protein